MHPTILQVLSIQTTEYLKMQKQFIHGKLFLWMKTRKRIFCFILEMSLSTLFSRHWITLFWREAIFNYFFPLRRIHQGILRNRRPGLWVSALLLTSFVSLDRKSKLQYPQSFQPTSQSLMSCVAKWHMWIIKP